MCKHAPEHTISLSMYTCAMHQYLIKRGAGGGWRPHTEQDEQRRMAILVVVCCFCHGYLCLERRAQNVQFTFIASCSNTRVTLEKTVPTLALSVFLAISISQTTPTHPFFNILYIIYNIYLYPAQQNR